MRSSIPVTLLTGFLGAGKTTLLNHLLRTSKGRFAVIENEFGDVGIDSELIDPRAEAVFALDEGCVCCVTRDDLVAVLAELTRYPVTPDRVIIEASGLADPAPVVRVIQRFGTTFHLDGVVTVVDARHADHDLMTHTTWAEQVACADVLIINKVDLVDRETVERLQRTLRQQHPTARVVHATHSEVPLDAVFGLDDGVPNHGHDHNHNHDHDHGHGHDHDHSHDHDHDHDHGHGHAHDHDHDHDASIVSVSVQAPGDLNVDAFDDWLGRVLRDAHATVLRMKGVIALQGQPRRFILQGVRDVVDVHPDRPWKDDERETRLVFIGRNLDVETLRRGLVGCTR